MAAGSLLLPESRKIARLLLEKTGDDGWHRALVVDNILQKKSPATAIRLSRLIKNRLILMSPNLWTLVVNGEKEVAVQALLASAIKHSLLLGEFMRTVIKGHIKAFDYKLLANDWRRFLDECSVLHPEIDEWSKTTRNKLGQVVFRILAESRYIETARVRKLLELTSDSSFLHTDSKEVFGLVEADAVGDAQDMFEVVFRGPAQTTKRESI